MSFFYLLLLILYFPSCSSLFPTLSQPKPKPTGHDVPVAIETRLRHFCLASTSCSGFERQSISTCRAPGTGRGGKGDIGPNASKNGGLLCVLSAVGRSLTTINGACVFLRRISVQWFLVYCFFPPFFSFIYSFRHVLSLALFIFFPFFISSFS